MREICFIVKSFKRIVVALFLIFHQIGENSHAFAQSNVLDGLFEQLQASDAKNIERLERNIWREWRRSGSDAVDFLLERGMDAMSGGDLDRYGPSVSDIEETLRLNPRHFGAMGGFGMILENTERPKQAMAVYKRLLKVHPHNKGAQEALARLSELLQGTAL